MQITPDLFMEEQAKHTWQFILLGVIMPIISVAVLYQMALVDMNHALAVGGGAALIGLIGGLLLRQHYLRHIARKVILLTIPEYQERSLSDLKLVVNEVTALVKEYEQKSIQEAEEYEVKTKHLATLLAEAEGNQERLTSTLDRMRQILERHEVSDLETA